MAGVSNLMKTSWCLHRKKINTEWRGEGWEQVLTFTVQWQQETRFAGAQQGTCCFHLNSPNSQVTGYKPDAFMVMYIQWTAYSYIWFSLLSLLWLPFPLWTQICRWATTGPNKRCLAPWLMLSLRCTARADFCALVRQHQASSHPTASHKTALPFSHCSKIGEPWKKPRWDQGHVENIERKRT